jgi:threonine/homoserine/homoserine lactone efflux protein
MSISLQELGLYMGALVLLWVTPGPVWLAIIARGLAGGVPAAWPVAIGVTVGDFVWPLIAILGVAWIASQFDDFLTVMRWVAVAMFLGMGYLLIRHAGKALGGPDSRLTRPGTMAGLGAGVLAVLGNPKAVLFYMGVLPGFFDLARLTVADIVAILAVSVIIPLAGNLGLAIFVGRARALVSSPDAVRRLNVASGVLLIVVGVAIGFL